MNRPVVLFTDFGVTGPYVGQVRAVLLAQAPGAPVVELMADAPAFDPRASSCLLAALLPHVPANAVMLCVVDPGVGTSRRPVILDLDGRLFVGPDNGLFEMPTRRATRLAAWEIGWRPQSLSATFHGRDLFAPVAARLARGEDPAAAGGMPITVPRQADWPDEMDEIIYLDPYGNGFTGLAAHRLPKGAVLRIGQARLERARTYGDLPAGVPFWYENSLGLVEVAVARGSAQRVLGLEIGTKITVEVPGIHEIPDAGPGQKG